MILIQENKARVNGTAKPRARGIIDIASANYIEWPFDMRLEEITPARAKELLELNKNNRPVSKKRVNQYTWDISNYRWELMPCDPIILGEDNEVYNAQHRLMAVVKAGKSIMSLVVYNFPERLRHLIDNGRSRSNSDHLKIVRGVKNANAVASIISSWHSLVFGRPLTGSISYLEDFLDHESIVAVIEIANLSRDASLGWFRGTIAALYETQPDAALEFLSLCSNFSKDPYTYPEPSDSPILGLFKWLERRKILQGPGARVKRQCALVYAFDYWVTGRRVKQFKFGNRNSDSSIRKLADRYELSHAYLLSGFRSPDIEDAVKAYKRYSE